MLNTLDHVIVAVRDLDAAVRSTEALFGRRASWRGVHPGQGTANALFRVANTYLELLAPSGEGPIGSVLGRHLARALESRIVAKAMMGWLGELKPGEPVATELTIPDEGTGVGLTGAPRGALGHWITIKDQVIDRYQLVVPTTWNGSPADANGTPGPIEQALIGTEIRDRDNPFEIVRIIRSFDPCLACSVHVLTAAGELRRVLRVV